jgi:hypothetical protein
VEKIHVVIYTDWIGIYMALFDKPRMAEIFASEQELYAASHMVNEMLQEVRYSGPELGPAKKDGYGILKFIGIGGKGKGKGQQEGQENDGSEKEGEEDYVSSNEGEENNDGSAKKGEKPEEHPQHHVTNPVGVDQAAENGQEHVHGDHQRDGQEHAHGDHQRDGQEHAHGDHQRDGQEHAHGDHQGNGHEHVVRESAFAGVDVKHAQSRDKRRTLTKSETEEFMKTYGSVFSLILADLTDLDERHAKIENDINVVRAGFQDIKQNSAVVQLVSYLDEVCKTVFEYSESYKNGSASKFSSELMDIINTKGERYREKSKAANRRIETIIHKYIGKNVDIVEDDQSIPSREKLENTSRHVASSNKKKPAHEHGDSRDEIQPMPVPEERVTNQEQSSIAKKNRWGGVRVNPQIPTGTEETGPEAWESASNSGQSNMWGGSAAASKVGLPPASIVNWRTPKRT